MTLHLYLGNNPLPNTPPTEEDSDGYLNWGNPGIPIFDYLTLYDKNIYVRFRTDLFDPEEDDPTDPTFYSNVFVLNAVIEYIHPQKPFVEGDEGFVFEPFPVGGVHWQLIGGIEDGTRYNYFSIFDQCDLLYLPFRSPYDFEGVSNQPLPPDNYDPANRIYPVDTVMKAVQDPRDIVLTKYKLTVTYSRSSPTDPNPLQEEFLIKDTCSQAGDAGIALRNILDKSSFVAKYRPLKTTDYTDQEFEWFNEEITV